MAILALMVDGVAVSKFDLPVGETSIGRSTDNTVHIDDIAVSSHHAKIKVTPDPYLDGMLRYELEDLGSTNATKLNSHKISSSTFLKDGDQVLIGYNLFKFIDDQTPDFESTAVILPEDRV
ncbi:MAG TPA: FHA domain-containing protein [Aeromonadales bacterium]|nr:FHA domain-containing protein [Aeromonadales bacterium]